MEKKYFIWSQGEKRSVAIIRKATKEDGYGRGFLVVGVKAFYSDFCHTVTVHKSLVHEEK